jgi:hypothetical protein
VEEEINLKSSQSVVVVVVEEEIHLEVQEASIQNFQKNMLHNKT